MFYSHVTLGCYLARFQQLKAGLGLPDRWIEGLRANRRCCSQGRAPNSWFEIQCWGKGCCQTAYKTKESCYYLLIKAWSPVHKERMHFWFYFIWHCYYLYQALLVISIRCISWYTGDVKWKLHFRQQWMQQMQGIASLSKVGHY